VWASGLEAKAQIEVTGGELTINGAEVFQPDSGDRVRVDSPTTVIGNETNAIIYDGNYQLDQIQIETNQGPIPTTAIFQPTTLPQFDSNSAPITGNNINNGNFSGQFQGTLSFRSLTPNGGALFRNIPTTLNFTVTEATNPTELGAVTEFRAENFVLTEIGNAESANAVGVVGRQTAVKLVQYDLGNLDGSAPNGEATAENRQVLNLFVPAARYDVAREGVGFGYESLTLGFDDGQIFTPPGFNIDGSTIFDNGVIDDSFGVLNTTTTIIDGFTSSEIVTVTFGGRRQARPVLPTTIFIVRRVFVFQNVRGGVWFDPPTADGFEYTMTPRDVPVGLASRVFPGMTGVEQAEDALFTAISGFPQDIDADDRFTVIVDDQVLGEFGPGDRLRLQHNH
ncbi:MAG: hypothetical protein F6K04_27550, partial [Leptolyngbya sp. SIO4C5]|nr:hypothetical protein [Leptolyngbya sp. SIO4C5]